MLTFRAYGMGLQDKTTQRSVEYLMDRRDSTSCYVVAAVGVDVDRRGAALGTAAKARDGTARGSIIITQTKLRLKQTKQNINKLEY